MLLKFILFILFYTADQICNIAPSVGLQNTVAKCLPEGASIPYHINIYSSNKYVNCQINLTLHGHLASSKDYDITINYKFLSSKFTLITPTLGVLNKLSLSVKEETCKLPFVCSYIHVHDSYRLYRFQCEDSLQEKDGKVEYYLAGTTPYKIMMITDLSVDSNLKIRLEGMNGASTAYMNLYSGSIQPQRTFHTTLYGIDVGRIKKIYIANSAKNAFRFLSLVIIDVNDSITKFTGGQYIGGIYDKMVSFEIGSNTQQIDSPIPIYCYTRLTDILVNVLDDVKLVNSLSWTTVECPSNCASTNYAYTIGLGLHPSQSAICVSAIADGILPISGGRLLITVHNPDSRELIPIFNNITINDASLEVLPFARTEVNLNNNIGPFYTMTLVESVDDIILNVRLLNIFDKISNHGRVEIRLDDEWMSMCSKGESDGVLYNFAPSSAQVICRELGFLYGYLPENTILNTGLSNPKGKLLTGPLLCNGNETNVNACPSINASTTCTANDIVIVHCTNRPIDTTPISGSLRIVGKNNIISDDGIGRLEFYDGISWVSICNDNWNYINALVACNQMGYTDINNEIAADDTDKCENIKGQDLCGSLDETRIGVTNVICTGKEMKFAECKMEISDNIFCIQSENVIIGCKGQLGDPSGVGLFAKEDDNLYLNKYLFPYPVEITCETTLESYVQLGIKAHTRKSNDLYPGEVFIVKCPKDCEKKSGYKLIGSIIYHPNSSICIAAIHTGLTLTTNSIIAVNVNHGQSHYSSQSKNSIRSEEGTTQTIIAFTVSLISPSIASRINKEPTYTNAGISRFSKKWLENRYKYVSIIKSSDGIQTSFLQLDSKSPTNNQNLKDAEKQFANNPHHYFCNNDNSINKFTKTNTNNIYMESRGTKQDAQFIELTIFMQFKFNDGTNWRTILSGDDCHGFILSISPEDILVFEQLCTNLIQNFDFTLQPNVWYNVSLSISQKLKKVSIIINSTNIYDFTTTNQINLNYQIKIASLTRLNYDLFEGEISAILLYDKMIEPNSNMYNYIFTNLDAICNSKKSKEVYFTTRYSDFDYRMCISDCKDIETSDSAPELIGNRTAYISHTPIQLTCEDNLLSVNALSGKINEKKYIKCPKNCITNDQQNVTVLIGNLFPGRFPVCIAASLLSLNYDESSAIEIIIKPGYSSYISETYSRLIKLYSKSDYKYDINSYEVLTKKDPELLNCETDAKFITLKSTENTKHLFKCPANCISKNSKINSTNNKFDILEPICISAVKAGVISNQAGGLVTLVLASNDEMSNKSVDQYMPKSISANSNYNQKVYSFLNIIGGYNCLNKQILDYKLNKILQTDILCDTLNITASILQNNPTRISIGNYKINIENSTCNVQINSKNEKLSYSGKVKSFLKGYAHINYFALPDYIFLEQQEQYNNEDEYNEGNKVEIKLINNYLTVFVNKHKCYNKKILVDDALASPIKILGNSYIEYFIVDV